MCKLPPSINQQAPNFLAQGTCFMEDNFFMGGGEGWFLDDSITFYLLCPLFLTYSYC